MLNYRFIEKVALSPETMWRAFDAMGKKLKNKAVRYAVLRTIIPFYDITLKNFYDLWETGHRYNVMKKILRKKHLPHILPEQKDLVGHLLNQ